jgi:prepilin-type N-terminal cleavage/methylation domain-containing protein
MRPRGENEPLASEGNAGLSTLNAAQTAQKHEHLPPTSRACVCANRRAGISLAEVVVVLAILGVFAGVAGLAARSLARTDTASERASAIADARRRALEMRRPVTLTVQLGNGTARLLALPDGSVRADTGLGLDPLTGRPHARR